MANKKALMYDADAYTPTDGDLFKWDTSNDYVIPFDGGLDGFVSYSTQHTGIGGSAAAQWTVGQNNVCTVSGQVAVTVITPGTGSSYVVGDTAVWHLQGVIIKHTTGGTFTVYPSTYLAPGSAGPTYDLSSGNNLFSAALLTFSAGGGVFYATYTPEVSGSATVANTVVRIDTKLLVTTNSIV
jgi:hypothetical protein